MKYIYISIYLLISTFGLILFKLGANYGINLIFENKTFNLTMNLFSVVGILLYLISFILYLFLISHFNLSYLIPFTTGIAQVLIVFFSSVILKENITIFHILGITMIIIGVLFINN